MNDHVERARALVGCRFRPQGRDSATGLDCIGLIAAVFDIAESRVARDYRLRDGNFDRLRSGLDEIFRPIPAARALPGDVLLFAVAPDQPHLAVCTLGGFVHAHAGLRRVVETPGAAPWPIISAYRRRVRGKRRR